MSIAREIARTLANSWWDIKIRGDRSLDELVFWRVETFGCQGTSTQYKGKTCVVSAYLPEERAHLLDLAALALRLRQDALTLNLAAPEIKWTLIDEEDWSSSWKAHWQPQEIGDRFLICPAWHEVPAASDRVVIRLDPGVAFGTGTHATTQLCLEGLEMRLDGKPSDARVADIGCGSGILAIGAALMGAERVFAVDTDPIAVRAACYNRGLNHIDAERLSVEEGSLKDLIDTLDAPVDGFFCNILAETIVDLIPQMGAIAKTTTWGVLSGILLDQIKPIADTLEQNGWVVATLWRRQEWCCFNIRRS